MGSRWNVEKNWRESSMSRKEDEYVRRGKNGERDMPVANYEDRERNYGRRWREGNYGRRESDNNTGNNTGFGGFRKNVKWNETDGVNKYRNEGAIHASPNNKREQNLN